MNGVVIAKSCKVCGQAFTTEWPRQTYCSEECRRGKRECIQCSATFLFRDLTTGKF
jgi:predicted nucleic acid-binding Zn ribbon protein